LGHYLDVYNKIKGINYGDQASDFESYPYGTGEKVTSSGIVFNLLRDSRKNSINPDNGFYTNLSYQMFLPELGSTYRWNGLLGDARKYIRLSRKNRQILGLRFLYWGSFGESPYLDLPATFTDRESRMGRGYYFARFRGSQLLYGETEYRFNLSRNGFWGGVLFANLQAFTKKQGDPFIGYDPSAGFGFRIKFNKQSNANLTVDFGFGKNSFNWHVNLGEFF
jgi:outer membrane protein assembly factor BamA